MRQKLNLITAILLAISGVIWIKMAIQDSNEGELLRNDFLYIGIIFIAIAVVQFYVSRKKDGDSGPPGA